MGTPESPPPPAKYRVLQFFTVLLMDLLAGTEVDILVPSFPELRQVFDLSPSAVELILGVNFATQCTASLFAGNMGDRYGRRPVLLWSLVIFLVGSLGCLCATQYWQLLVGRALQGVGISGPVVLALPVIMHLYPGILRQQKMMSIANGTVLLAMAFAPIAGSHISLWFHWRGNCLALLVMGLITFMFTLIFIQDSPKKPHVSLSLAEYNVLFRSSKALYYLGTYSFSLVSYWLFLGFSPLLYIGDLGMSLHNFGLHQGSITAALALASFSAGYMLEKFGQRTFGLWSLGLLGLFIIATLGLVVFKVNNPLIITSVMWIFSLGVLFPSYLLYPLALRSVPNAEGRIAGLFTTMPLMLTAGVGQIVSLFYNGKFAPIGLGMCILLLIAFWFCYRLNRVEHIFTP